MTEHTSVRGGTKPYQNDFSTLPRGVAATTTVRNGSKLLFESNTTQKWSLNTQNRVQGDFGPPRWSDPISNTYSPNKGWYRFLMTLRPFSTFWRTSLVIASSSGVRITSHRFSLPCIDILRLSYVVHHLKTILRWARASKCSKSGSKTHPSLGLRYKIWAKFQLFGELRLW